MGRGGLALFGEKTMHLVLLAFKVNLLDWNQVDAIHNCSLTLSLPITYRNVCSESVSEPKLVLLRVWSEHVNSDARPRVHARRQLASICDTEK